MDMDVDVVIPLFNDVSKDPALQLLKKYTVKQSKLT